MNCQVKNSFSKNFSAAESTLEKRRGKITVTGKPAAVIFFLKEAWHGVAYYRQNPDSGCDSGIRLAPFKGAGSFYCMDILYAPCR